MILDLSINPIIVQIGPLQLGWHGVFTGLAVAIAIWLAQWRAAQYGLPSESLSRVASWAVVGGLVGARLFHVMDRLPYYLTSPLEALAIWQGGNAVYGAFLGSITAGLLAARRNRLPAWPLLDSAGPALLVGQSIGRLGCFLNGDAWGAPTGGFWGVAYGDIGALLPPELLGVPTHPYPLYEIAAELLLLAGLWAAGRRVTTAGSTFLLATLGYAAIRFILSEFRQESVLLVGLQQAQVVALVTGLAAIGGLVALRVKPRETWTDPAVQGERRVI